MSRNFWERHDATRLSPSAPQPPLFGVPESDDEEGPAESDRTFEVADERSWGAIDPETPSAGWRASEWADRPVRFIDGKDVGETVACLTSPFGGYPVPVRLSEIGAVVVRETGGALRREYARVERVVTMATDLFPWEEIEALAVSFQQGGFRLLSAPKPTATVNGQRIDAWSYDYEAMRKAAQNRSNMEMSRLEEAALARENSLPTVVDGRLEPRAGGLNSGSVPAIGVIKTHAQNYLHAGGMRLLYRLQPGQRTPAFVIHPVRESHEQVSNRPKVVSWFLRLAQQPGLPPNWGLIRVELPLPWFEKALEPPSAPGSGRRFIDQLTVLLREYRCRDETCGRAPVSLQPIVRAEQLLGALFTPHATLARRFYRTQGL